MNLDMFLLGYSLGRLNLYIKQFRQLNEAPTPPPQKKKPHNLNPTKKYYIHELCNNQKCIQNKIYFPFKKVFILLKFKKSIYIFYFSLYLT